MKSLFAGTLACALVLAVYGFYNSSDDVVELNPANFYPLVLQSDSLWLIEFYTPQCEDCQEHAAAWKTVATSLKGVVKVGAVDADRHKMFLGQYSFQKFPTVKIFGANKEKPEDYKGKPDIQAIIAGAMTALNILVKGRIDGETGGVDQGRQRRSTGNEKRVVIGIPLSYANFKKTALESDGVVLVVFLADWCEHCTSLVPKLLAVAEEIKVQNIVGILLASVDVDRYKFLAEAYGVTLVPTIKFFQKDKDVLEYNGATTTAAIVDYAKNLIFERVFDFKPLEVTLVPTIKFFQKDKDVLEYNGATTTAAIVDYAKNLIYERVFDFKPLEQEGSGDLVELKDDNFKKEVLESKDKWLVLVFNPKCEECINLVTDWSIAAKQLFNLTRAKVRLGAVDIEKNKSLRDDLLTPSVQVQERPILMSFVGGQGLEKRKVWCTGGQANWRNIMVVGMHLYFKGILGLGGFGWPWKPWDSEEIDE